MKIAIIGGGISGLGAAYLLQKDHDVTVFEKENSVGGHTATKTVEHNGRSYDIDTGFIVFNDWTYPNFIKLLDELGVESQDTRMSFSVKSDVRDLEYAGSSLNTLFAQRKNLLSPSYLKMLKDIVRFNKESIEDLEKGRIEGDMTLGEYLAQNNYGELFKSHYLVPMGSAIWSATLSSMEAFPLLFFVRFFKNHGLLSIKNRPQWRVIKGGSKSYLAPLCDSFKDRIRTGVNIQSVTRDEQGVSIQFEGQEGKEPERFDQVIFGCHSDQALAMLGDASDAEQSVLGAMPYQENDVILHTDISLLPNRRLAWSAWNYGLVSATDQNAILTYNMNILQGIESDTTFCVSLNTEETIDPNKILGRYRYAHPVFSLESVAATQRWSEVNGTNKTWFCGAYWANGFHEDGFSSALRVANALGVDW